MRNTIIILLILGLYFLGFGTYSKYQDSFTINPPQQFIQENPTKLVPIGLTIPATKTSVSIKEGGISNNQWILDKNYAEYLPTSGGIAEGYNTVIYAHNTKKLFGGLKYVKKGNSIIITNQKGKKYEYSVFSIQTVKGDEVKSIISEIPNTITLFTCDGIADEKRVVIKAKLVNS